METRRTWWPLDVRQRQRTQRLTTVILAILAAAVGWAVAVHLLGVDVRSPQMGDQPPAAIGLAQVVAASALASLAGWALLAVLERFTPQRAARVWLGVSLAALVVSLGAPLTGAGISTANRGALAVLHVVVAAVLVPGLLRTHGSGDDRHDE